MWLTSSRRRARSVAAADVECEGDACVDLRLVHLREVVEAAPVVSDERAVVDGVRRVHAEGVEAIAVEVERAFVREFDRDGLLVVGAFRALQPEMVNPRRVVEGLVDRAVAIDEPRSADAIGREVPAVDRGCGFARSSRRPACASCGRPYRARRRTSSR